MTPERSLKYMGNNNVSKLIFQKAAQEYFSGSFKLYSSVIGVIVFLCLVIGGIYFSKVALTAVFGEVGVGLYIAWAISISLSPLEVAGTTLFADKETSSNIKATSRVEHDIAKWLTVAMFSFDIVTNWAGFYIFAVAISNPVSFLGWLFIIVFGAFTAVSEIFVMWTLRSAAVNYVNWKYAKATYDSAMKDLERESQISAERDVARQKNLGNMSSNRPNVSRDFDRFAESSDQEYRPNLQPAMQRSNSYRGNGRNQPRG